MVPPNEPFHPNDQPDDHSNDVWSDGPMSHHPKAHEAARGDLPPQALPTPVFKPVHIVEPAPGFEATQVMDPVSVVEPTQAIPVVQTHAGVTGRKIGIGVVAVLAAIGLGFLAATFFGGSDGSDDSLIVDGEPDPADLAVVPLALTCPEGSTGSPTAESPTCTRTTTTSVDPIPGQTFTCPEGASGSPTADDPTCAADDSGTVAALRTTVYTCPSNSSGTPTVSDPFCSATVTSPVAAIKNITFSCPDGASGSPTADDPTCTSEPTIEQVDANESTIYSCPEGATGAPTVDDPTCTSTTTSTTPTTCASGQDVTADGRCLAGDAAPRSIGDDESCTADEVLQDADGDRQCLPVVAPTTCEVGTLNGTTCEESSQEAIAAETTIMYSCPAGSTGTPTDAEPFCSIRNAATVPADFDTTYSCPNEASGSPTEADPVCEQTTTSPVGSIATIDFSCPTGSSGMPTATNQTCTKDGSDTVPAIETSSFQCPEGTTGEPSSATSECISTVNETVAALAAE